MSQISPNVSTGPYTGDGIQTAFTFNFSIIEKHQILVVVDGAPLSTLVGYSVVFGDSSGTVTFTTPPADGAKILLVSNPDYLQTSNFDNQGAYNLATINLINRRGVIRDLVLKDGIDRALKLPIGTTAPTLDISDGNGKVLGYATGVGFIWVNNNDAAVAGDVIRTEGAATAAVAAAVSAGIDADRAESARDAASVSAGIYINEATGRAAVANSVVFLAVGATSDKAVDVWQRVNSGSSTFLRSYPSLSALTDALAELTITATAAATAVRDDLDVAVQKAPVSLPAAQAADLTADRMLDPATFVDKVLGTNAGGYGAKPYKPVATLDYIFNAAPAADATWLLRAGQQHLVAPSSDGNNKNIGTLTHRVNVASYGGEGDYGACLDTRMPLAGQTWTASGGSWTTTVTMRNSLDFSVAGANVAGVHLMLWHVPAPHDDVLGDLAALKIGGANPAANDTAVDATSGVFAWSIKYSGQTAGDIRGLSHVGDTYILRIKMADGSDPNGQPLFLADYRSGLVVYGGSHGHVLFIGTCGKDSVNFGPFGNASGGLISWFESLTILGVGGHGGVGPKCTTGAFKAIGVPIPGENTYPDGQTGGGGCHNFSAGFNLGNQYLYNGSIHVENFAIGCYSHGSGGGSEAYRGWNVAGEIYQSNCNTGFEIEITLNEGFRHAGRLVLLNPQQGINSYPGQYFQLGGGGGLFLPKPSHTVLATFTGGGARETVIGSDDPEKIFILDASQVAPGAPNYYGASLYSRTDHDAATPAPTLILKGVEDHSPIDIASGRDKFGIGQTGFYENAPFVHLVLIRSKIGDVWGAFDFSPDYPMSLDIDGDSEIGFHGRTWAQIETAMAGLGRACTIAPGAKAVNRAGAVVDIKT